MSTTYHWRFPLPRTHTGMLLGNARLGAMVWGGGERLCVTLGRADVWDHRGGSVWTDQMSYANIRRMLAAGQEAQLNELFRSKPAKPGEAQRPTMLPLGRFELHWPGATLTRGTLDLRRGELIIHLRHGGQRHAIRLCMLPDASVVLVSLPAALRDVKVTPVTSWQYVGDTLAEVSFKPPQMFDEGATVGWTQELPADPAYSVACRREGELLSMAVERGTDAAEAQAAALGALVGAAREGYSAGLARSAAWWRDYWRRVPRVRVPNQRLQFLYDYGMYKFAGMTNPLGVPAALQGPWVEEYQMPPWSNDYHFNINVQMCYQPAFHGNCLHHLKPLFDMIASWTDTLRHNARAFAGVEDGRMLPHAVSDTCVFITGYWGHSVDHGSTAWVAQMMYRYYRFTMDRAFLREVAYPFMVGTLRVYEAMLDRDGQGGYRLELGVSPEYFNFQRRGYGPNASFQLAALHRLLEDVIEAAEVLGEAVEPAWREIQAKLPRACVAGEGDKRRITLWDGQDLDETHRHHSHLAGITPFDVIDVSDAAWKPIVAASLRQWLYRGPGLWSGWCIPWASTLHSHVGNAGAAELWLEIFDRLYTNEGRGTLHDPAFAGFSVLGVGSTTGPDVEHEIMQMDGGMGAAAAVQEMLLHTRRGVVHLFAGCPARWRRVAFAGMRCEGAFLLSAQRVNGTVRRVRIVSEAGGELQLHNCFGGDARGPDGQMFSGDVLHIPMKPGQTLDLTPA
jgi:hypothetical protein